MRKVLIVMSMTGVLATGVIPASAAAREPGVPTDGRPQGVYFKLQPADYTYTVTYLDKAHRKATVSFTLSKGTDTENTLAISDPQLGQVYGHAQGRNAKVVARTEHRYLPTGLKDQRTYTTRVYSIRKKNPKAKAFIEFTFSNGFLGNQGTAKILLP